MAMIIVRYRPKAVCET